MALRFFGLSSHSVATRSFHSTVSTSEGVVMARDGKSMTGLVIELPFRIVDVFTTTPLTGNALCVVFEPAPEPVMAAVAREVNLSETTFVTCTGPRSYDVSIWTPAGEVPFAGHPSLGTAWALGPGRWNQRSPGATVEVVATEEGAVMTQPDPVMTEVSPASALLALGLPPEADAGAWVADVGGFRHLLVPTDRRIDRLEPQPGALRAAAREADAMGVAVFAPLDDANLHARVFIPSSTVPEDPGTGSAAGAIGLVGRRVWGTAEDLVVHQGGEIGRPCRIEVHAEEGAMQVGGRVVASAEGRFTLAPPLG